MTRTFTLSACTLGIAVCLLVVNTAMAVANQQSVTLASNLPSLSFQDQPDANKKGRPGDSTENREVVIQRLHREFEHARSSLENQDAGRDTSDVQKRIIRDLDKLIDEADRGERTPSGSNGKKANNQDGAQQGAGKPIPQEKPARGTAKGPAEMNVDPAGKNMQSNVDKNAGVPRNLAGIWGELLKRKRLEVDVYAGDHFVPSYEELLRQYYRAIAEATRRDEQE